MIPRRLVLRNFLSHEDTTIDFRPLHAAVLTGRNGAGKSAILDGITFALWGESRAAGAQVVRIGEAEASVELVFDLAGVEYTVRRRRSTSKHVPTSLEFFAGTAPLTKGGVRETQAAINATLRMDYETFVSSAFLAQGKSDVFTAATPKTRKELLGEILGLRQYDTLAAAAREAAKMAQARADGMDAQRARLDASVEALPAAIDRLTEVRIAVETLAYARDDAEREHGRRQTLAAEQRAADAEAVRHEAARLDAADAAALAAVARDQASVKVEMLTLDAAGHDLARDRYAVWRATTTAEAEAATVARAWERLDRQVSETQAKGRALLAEIAAGITARTEAARATREEKVARLAVVRLRLDALPAAEASLTTARVRLAEMGDVTAAFEAARSQGVTIQGKQTEATVRAEGHDRTAAELAAKLHRILLAAGADDGAPCPTCARPLTAHAKEEVQADMQAAITTARGKAEEEQTVAAGLGRDLDLKREECKALQEQVRARVDVQRQVDKLEVDVAALADLAVEASTLADAIAAADQPDERIVYLSEQSTKAEAAMLADVAALVDERDATGHDPVAYVDLRARLAELAGAPAAWDAAQAAQVDLERARAEVARLAAEVASHGEAVARAAAARDEVRARLTASGEVVTASALAEAEAAVTRLRAAERDAQQQEASRLADVNRMEADGAELFGIAARWQAALDEAVLYRDVAAAFGRNGIQAQAIEAAIPEIEEEANRILGALADNRTHVQLVTQRELRGGGTAETLDVRIADDAGERPYESFSGGEAFRVNFALRLAISRLLARRSGAPLQLLVIDEGFGTQDDAGRARLLEAINAVAGEFALILIVTHIKDLVDAFNQRIDVTKVGGVSSVRMVA